MWHIWGTEVLITGFWWKNLKEGDNLEDMDVDVIIIIIIIIIIFKKGDGDMDWIDQAQSTERWRALLKATMKNFQVP